MKGLSPVSQWHQPRGELDLESQDLILHCTRGVSLMSAFREQKKCREQGPVPLQCHPKEQNSFPAAHKALSRNGHSCVCTAFLQVTTHWQQNSRTEREGDKGILVPQSQGWHRHRRDLPVTQPVPPALQGEFVP